MTPIFRSLFWLAIAAITLLALLPQEEVTVTTGWDKANHFIAFFVLLLLLDRAYPDMPMYFRKIGLILAYGVGLEILQAFTQDRQASWLDLLADGSGVVGYIILRRPIQRLVDILPGSTPSL